jgi:hypothetical protein
MREKLISRCGASPECESGVRRKRAEDPTAAPSGDGRPFDLEAYLFNSGTALILHGQSSVVDRDLGRLRDLPRKQRTTITSVVLSNTEITGECFAHLAHLPNLKALYASNTRVDDEAPIERLPKTVAVINLDHTRVGDRIISRLRRMPRLREVYLRNTGVTARGVELLGLMTNLHECRVGGTDLTQYPRGRLGNLTGPIGMIRSRLRPWARWNVGGARSVFVRIGVFGGG